MPATPAWPPQSAPRLFVEATLSPGEIRIDGAQAHYLISVMRIKLGAAIKLFDDRTGEWAGVAQQIGKRDLILEVTDRRRSVVDKLNLERLRTHMIEAAEQCGRTALPLLDELVKLPALLRDWPEERTLFFADEAGCVPAIEAMRAHPGPAAILIGPEGGFDDAERAAIKAHPRAVGISLGPRILRAETAAAAAIALWMGAAGDW